MPMHFQILNSNIAHKDICKCGIFESRIFVIPYFVRAWFKVTIRLVCLYQP